MPWEKSYNRAIVLDRAARAFWAKGYEATSMAELVRVTGVSRGSLYTAFEDKRAIFLNALEHYDQTYCAAFLSDLAGSHAPKEAISVVFKAAIVPRDDRPKGCLLVNTATEMSPRDYEISRFVDARLRAFEEFFHDNIVGAAEEGTIRDDLDARATAQVLLGLYVGLRVLTRASARTEAIPVILAQVEQLLE